jgi:hypothetical protein
VADDLYGALDWLVERQSSVEQTLAERHLQSGGMALYDLSSSYFRGRRCRLAMASILFKDEQPMLSDDPVSKAQPSEQAQRKASQQKTEDGSIVRSFKSLLGELATRARVTIRIDQTVFTFARLAKATPIVKKALKLIQLLPIVA